MDEIDKRDVMRLLNGIEDGMVSSDEMFNITQKLDPLLSFFLFRYLRDKHPITESDSGAGKRLLELIENHPELKKLLTPPRNEPMVDWFNDSYSTKTFFKSPQEYIDLIIDKMEG